MAENALLTVAILCAVGAGAYFIFQQRQQTIACELERLRLDQELAEAMKKKVDAQEERIALGAPSGLQFGSVIGGLEQSPLQADTNAIEQLPTSEKYITGDRDPETTPLTRKQQGNFTSVVESQNGEEVTSTIPASFQSEKTSLEGQMLRLREEALTDGTDDAVAAAEGMDQMFEQFMEETYIPVYEESQYNNWSTEKATAAPGQCTKMNTDGTWEGLPCAPAKMPPLCRRKKPNGTFEFFIPKESTVGTDWKKMRSQCKAGGGEFTRPLSEEENQNVMQVLNNTSIYNVWMNLARKPNPDAKVAAHQATHEAAHQSTAT